MLERAIEVLGTQAHELGVSQEVALGALEGLCVATPLSSSPAGARAQVRFLGPNEAACLPEATADALIAVEMDIDDGVIAGAYACSYSLAFRSVMGLGIAHEVTDPAEKEHGLARIMEHAAPGAPVTFTEQALERVGVWRIDVVELTGKQRKAR